MNRSQVMRRRRHETAATRDVRCFVTARTITTDDKTEMGRSENCRVPEEKAVRISVLLGEIWPLPKYECARIETEKRIDERGLQDISVQN